MSKTTIQNSDTNVSKTTIKSVKIGMQVKHYSSAFNSDDGHWKMTEDFGETNTDRSTYKPDVSLVRAFLGSGGNSKKQMLYDFPDGKDDGQTIRTFLRQPGLDITEVETAEKIMTTIIKDKKEFDESNAKSEKAQKEIIDAIKSATDSITGKSSPDSSASASNPAPVQ